MDETWRLDTRRIGTSHSLMGRFPKQKVLETPEYINLNSPKPGKWLCLDLTFMTGSWL